MKGFNTLNFPINVTIVWKLPRVASVGQILERWLTEHNDTILLHLKMHLTLMSYIVMPCQPSGELWLTLAAKVGKYLSANSSNFIKEQLKLLTTGAMNFNHHFCRGKTGRRVKQGISFKSQCSQKRLEVQPPTPNYCWTLSSVTQVQTISLRILLCLGLTIKH